MNSLAGKPPMWWFSILLRGVAVFIIAEAAIWTALTHVDPKLDVLGDPKYLAATEHFWKFVPLGVVLFLIGWWLKRNSNDRHQKA